MKSLWCLPLLIVACATAQPRKCEVSGCNGEICSEPGKKMISPCVVLPQHQCLKNSRCEIQNTGKCGWTQTPEYRECMKKFQLK